MTERAPQGIPDARQLAHKIRVGCATHPTVEAEIADDLVQFQRETILGLADELWKLDDEGASLLRGIRLLEAKAKEVK